MNRRLFINIKQLENYSTPSFVFVLSIVQHDSFTILLLNTALSTLDYCTLITVLLLFDRENAFPFMWDRLVFKLVMHAGSCTALNMVGVKSDY